MPKPVTLLVVSNPAARHLRHLASLPDSTRIVVGNRTEAFEQSVGDAKVILNCFEARPVIQWLLPRAPHIEWLHSLSAGVDALLFPELQAHPAVVTNGRGVFAESLGEFVLSAILYFAKDLGRMLRAKARGQWQPFDVEMIEGRTLGIVGFGAIGKAAARRAEALGMRVLTLRRAEFSPQRLRDLLAASDYVTVSAPLTGETRGMIGEAELHAMKPSGVLINVGRGPVVVESALIAALRDGAIRGAALDVFDVEPLPAGHPFWSMDNVLLSPHCADNIASWLDDAMAVFLRNFELFGNGMPLENVIDKQAGY